MTGQPSGGPINILTAIRSRWGWTRQRFKFWIARQPEWIARGFAGREAGRFTLKRLNILHTATWLRADRFPAIGGCPRERYHWVLFCSNFSGPWDPYRQAFLDVPRKGVRTLWGTSIGFPRFPKPGSRYELEAWIAYRLPPTDHYFRAYPSLSPNDVRGAVRLAREIEALALASPDPTQPGDATALKPTFDQLHARVEDYSGDATALKPTFDQLLARVQDCLGGVPDEALTVSPVLGPPNATGMSNMVSVMPILPGYETRTRDRIAALPTDAVSPFRNVPGTHFARLAVLDRQTAAFHPRHAVTLRNSWLLLAVDFDGDFATESPSARRMDVGEIRRYLRAIDEVPALRDIWRDCYGFRPGVALEDLLEPSVIERFVLFRDHGDTTLREIVPALQLKRTFMRLLGTGRLDEADDIGRFLEDVRRRVEARRRGGSRPVRR
jgi:hypothetical protein